MSTADLKDERLHVHQEGFEASEEAKVNHQVFFYWHELHEAGTTLAV